jgi:hypothetical protein
MEVRNAADAAGGASSSPKEEKGMSLRAQQEAAFAEHVEKAKNVSSRKRNSKGGFT